MTVKAMARQLQVSPMTIYRRLQRQGVNIGDLRDAITGELTAAGVAVIGSLFDAAGITAAATGGASSAQQVTKQDAEHVITGDQDGDALTVAVLRVQLDAANNRIEILERERDLLISQLNAATAALEREQTDRQHERQLFLTGSDGGQRGGRWFQRLFKRSTD